jgi:hypothetical protein
VKLSVCVWKLLHDSCHIGAVMQTERDKGPPAWRSFVYIYIYIYTYGSGFLLVFLLLQNPPSWKSELKEHIKRHERDITFHVPWGPCHGPKTWAKFFFFFFDENHNLNDNPWPYFYHV